MNWFEFAKKNAQDEFQPPRDCECGDPATTFYDEGDDYAYWTGQPRLTPICEDCKQQRENREPSEPDGEAFRGGEADAYRAEQQHRTQRLK